MTTAPADALQIVDRWAAAEAAGDAPGLDDLLHPEFVFAGPVGYLRTRAEWLARFTPGDPYETSFTTFTFTVDVPTRVVGDTAVVVGTQYSAGTHQGERFDGHYRGTVVLVRDPVWLVLALHLSLREPPVSAS